MTVEDARRLFVEARDFESGKVPYIAEDSEIRRRAAETYGHATISTLLRVCGDIFYVLACQYMDSTPSDNTPTGLF